MGGKRQGQRGTERDRVNARMVLHIQLDAQGKQRHQASLGCAEAEERVMQAEMQAKHAHECMHGTNAAPRRAKQGCRAWIRELPARPHARIGEPTARSVLHQLVDAVWCVWRAPAL